MDTELPAAARWAWPGPRAASAAAAVVLGGRAYRRCQENCEAALSPGTHQEPGPWDRRRAFATAAGVSCRGRDQT